MSFAIFYAKEGYDTTAPKLMGRNAAGASFLRGFLTHTRSETISCFAHSTADAAHFDTEFKKYGKARNLYQISYSSLKKLAVSGGVYYPGPSISQMANYRLSATGGSTNWSVCGITHTTSSAQAMDALTELITAPVQPWDAVICTSNAVKKNVESILQFRVNELRERLGINKIVLPLLPVIPLGIHTEDFNYTPEHRTSSRAKLQIGQNEVVVLYTGRLSFHAKAHPLPMYLALEEAAKRANKKVVLIECGWHASEFIENAFKEATELICPSVRAVTLDGRDSENRDTAWSSADIFCSLSDNIQETFGIVPLEAMAAGLPVVVSDWNGYKETVRHDVDGFRIPTMSSAPGSAGDLAHRHALDIDTYDMYCGYTSSLTAINIPKLIDSFEALFVSQSLREQMGESGRERVSELYDWRSIIPVYEELWAEQSDIRKSHESKQPELANSNRREFWAARVDPTISFSHYPTTSISDSTNLTMLEPSAAAALGKLAEYKKLKMVDYAKYVFPNDNELESIFEVGEQNLPCGCTAAKLLRNIPDDRKPYVTRGLVWLCKLGFFTFK